MGIKNIPIFLLILLLILLPQKTSAQNAAFRFDRISISDGLSQGTIREIIQDKNGFMWFATDDGLNRYDGYDFKVFRNTSPDGTGVGINRVTALHADHNGIIWVGTVNAGLIKYDPENEKFTVFQKEKGDFTIDSNNTIHSIAATKDSPNFLWLGTDGNGLIRFDTSKNEFTYYLNDPNNENSLVNNYIIDLYPDSKGNLWIGTVSKGLSKYSIQSNQFTNFFENPKDENSLSNNSVQAIYEDDAGMIWLGTNSGLDKYDPSSGQFTNFRNDPNEPNSLSDNSVTRIREIKGDPNSIWVGTLEGGLNKFDKTNGRFTHYQHDKFNNSSLSSNYIMSIFEDNSDVVWVGTFVGINKFSKRNAQFEHFNNIPNDSNSLNHNFVRAIFEDSKGILWIGTYGGLNRYDRKTGKFKVYVNDPIDNKSISSNFIRTISEDKSGKIWVGARIGLNEYDEDSDSFIRHLNTGSEQLLSDDRVWSAIVDSKNFLWVGTGGGINKIDLSKKNPKRMAVWQNDPNNENSLISSIALSMYEDRNNNLWIGTPIGLCVMNMETGDIIRYSNDPDNDKSLSNNLINAIYQSKSGEIWIATYGGGLNKLDRETQTFKKYGLNEGLPNETIYAILEDKDQNLWISTNMGISKFDPVKEIIENFDIRNGLQGNEFNGQAYFKNSVGQMFFGGGNGFNRFIPENVVKNEYPPPIVITDLKITNKSVNVGQIVNNQEILKQSIFMTKEIEMTYKENMIMFEFAALDYSASENNQYAYMLEGFDEEWLYVDSKRRFATYTNLSGGDYTFIVKGSNNDAVWNEDGASMKISIAPAFWVTWWFRSLVVFVFLGITLGLAFWRLKELSKLNILLNNKVIERTADLKQKSDELETKVTELEYSLDHINKLEGLLPICASCKKIRLEDEETEQQKNWIQIEKYISDRTDANFSHGICPDCSEHLYGDYLRGDGK